MTELRDIKRSLLETVKDRLPAISAANFYPDPPKGEYERPCCYLTFIERKPSKGRYIGTFPFDYTFIFTGEVLDGTESELVKVRPVEQAFIIGEGLPFYHFIRTSKYLREGTIEVVKWILQESKTDRVKNRISGELTITF